MSRIVVFAILGMITFAVYAFVPDDDSGVGPITIITPSDDLPLLQDSSDSPTLKFTDDEIREISDALFIGENIELLDDTGISETSMLEEIEAIEKLKLDDLDAVAEEAPQETQASGMRVVTGTINSSVYNTAVKAGLSSNQIVRLTRVLKPYLDFSRELRKGDKLTITLDPEAGQGSEDANQLHRIEFKGAKKSFVITRKDDSLEHYVAHNAEGQQVESRFASVKKSKKKAKIAKAADEKKTVAKKADKPKAKKPDEAKVAKAEPKKTEKRVTKKTDKKQEKVAKKSSKADKKVAKKTKNSRRLEATIDFSLFSAARSAGLSTTQTVKLRSVLDPYIDYNKELRKGDKLVITMNKSAKKIESIEFLGAKKQLLAVREENGDFAVTDRVGGIIQVAKKKARKQAVAKAEKKKRSWFKRKSKTPSINGWKPRDKALARVYARIHQSGKVNKHALQKAFKYYESNRYSNKLSDRHMAIADYTQTSLTRRLHIINMKSGDVKSYQVAHGRRSGPVGGRVHSVSNVVGSNKTSRGFFKVGFKEGRTRTKGYHYLPIQGLEAANRKVGLPTRMGGRDVIVHTARYVESGGRSNGCFAIRPQDKYSVFSKLKGALLLSYSG